ncbi:glycoside hydrolase family 9 protein [Nevskia sp.]|uniref:glycoside hydrolase family 9 protein n=1 Tax=Nevskia sp. TaxID=1929292 RepID=UPI0025CC2B07|nr:glycoside hydrolase family 9 protein [Nevskia sp.]
MNRVAALLRFPLRVTMASVLAGGLLSGCDDDSEGTAQAADAPAAAAAVAKVSAATRSVPDSLKAVPLDLHILVDQFGYRPGDPKVAVIRSPDAGFDAKDPYVPGEDYEVRRVADGEVVFTGKPLLWEFGKTQDSSGDHGWWFDFSKLDAPGEYIVFDTETKRRSAIFSIKPDVYADALKASVRMFFYQRSAFRKDAKFAGACWADEPAYIREFQDVEARDINDPGNPAKARDLSGGWFDAGDTNKYVTYAMQPVHQLLTSYELNPKVFSDDFNIPESGNGIPDVIDEVKWEIDWLKKMQNPDGSAALKVGAIDLTPADPPSRDTAKRYYIGSCTSSTIAVASMFAHAAQVYRQFPALENEATALEIRAIKAWERYQATPEKETACDSQKIHAGDADLDVGQQQGLAAVAAVYLYAITGEKGYDDYLKANYRDLYAYRDSGWSRYWPYQGEAALAYTRLPQADPGLRKTFLADKLADVKAGHGIYGSVAGDDLYRNFLHEPQYHWGSNNPRAGYGASNIDVELFDIDIKDKTPYRTRALDTLHYFHGVNPLGIVYLTNMASYGATRSVNAVFHKWFWEKSKWSTAGVSECGPAPGYVPGGPNATASTNGVPPTLQPPSGQPPQKSFKDWNTNSDAPWVVAEPAISYQAGYVRLVAAFAARP